MTMDRRFPNKMRKASSRSYRASYLCPMQAKNLGEINPDIALDREWRAVFGGPLPILGAPDIARRLISQHRAIIAGNRTGRALS